VRCSPIGLSEPDAENGFLEPVFCATTRPASVDMNLSCPVFPNVSTPSSPLAANRFAKSAYASSFRVLAELCGGLCGSRGPGGALAAASLRSYVPVRLNLTPSDEDGSYERGGADAEGVGATKGLLEPKEVCCAAMGRGDSCSI